ncbi:hypothetical protein NBRC110019_15820 [Neptunitalea chrysea]|uniref:TLC domain-containing protein n=2 Tax=Neptunitalea chrysea TaxID=1647581 RepID=A0A9W6B770_9FLAO|nr:hypothetical protein NBRC110019_15820 [Neptunitalea chrysea]
MLLTILHLIVGILMAIMVLLVSLLVIGGINNILLMIPALAFLTSLGIIMHKSGYKNIATGIGLGAIVLILVTFFFFKLIG